MEFDLHSLRSTLIDLGLLITTLVVFVRNRKLSGTSDVVLFSSLLLLNSIIMFAGADESWLSHTANFSLILAFAFCYSAVCKLIVKQVSWRLIIPCLLGYIVLIIAYFSVELSSLVRAFYTTIACIYLTGLICKILLKNRTNADSPSTSYLLIVLILTVIAFVFRLAALIFPEFISTTINSISIMVLSNLFLFLSFGLLLLIFEVINNKLLTKSELDYLSGIKNRRGFFKALMRKRDENTPYVLSILDIDHFKTVNDTYGHDAGDIVIKHIADKLTEMTSSKDILARFGGEEFCLLMNNDDQQALQRLEEIRRYFEKESINYPGGDIQITVCIGCVKTNLIFEEMIQKLLYFADISLYKAKQTGRNKVVCFERLVES
ncbi:GGDEF domain-containing protein [Thalassotalea sp. M1531]|uniref:diguanylate cyclase n=1 Tax=Thalassotalea algicola TaxID=2716224 RepID=A0A7Y0LC59_9GAMM|nr:GGDEF domain-containing protein [Thalassotalea algicola]NMP30976.1 GGDEF domain-containing protein [Thalassotalea algicola]